MPGFPARPLPRQFAQANSQLWDVSWSIVWIWICYATLAWSRVHLHQTSSIKQQMSFNIHEPFLLILFKRIKIDFVPQCNILASDVLTYDFLLCVLRRNSSDTCRSWSISSNGIWNSNIFYVNMFRQFYILSIFSSKQILELSYLNPMIGYSLHILHLAWCLAVSAADSLCNTGSQTMLCGSCCSQLKKCTASISFLSFPAFSKQLRTLGSMFEPPNAATSPNCLGTCMQSCNKSPSFRWSTSLLGSAIKRNRSANNTKKRP